MFERRNNVDIPHRNTCNWILGHEEYKKWKSKHHGLLWIKGKPGAGKSTLMRFIYKISSEDNQSNDKIDLDFFFTGQGLELQKTPLGMLRSLLHQLYSQDTNIRPKIREVFEEKRAGSAPNEQDIQWQPRELKNLFIETVLLSARSRKIVIFIDALDEAGQGASQDIGSYFHNLDTRTGKEGITVKACISCRHYPMADIGSGPKIWVEKHNKADIAVLSTMSYISSHRNLQINKLGKSSGTIWFDEHQGSSNGLA